MVQGHLHVHFKDTLALHRHQNIYLALCSQSPAESKTFTICFDNFQPVTEDIANKKLQINNKQHLKKLIVRNKQVM